MTKNENPICNHTKKMLETAADDFLRLALTKRILNLTEPEFVAREIYETQSCLNGGSQYRNGLGGLEEDIRVLAYAACGARELRSGTGYARGIKNKVTKRIKGNLNELIAAAERISLNISLKSRFECLSVTEDEEDIYNLIGEPEEELKEVPEELETWAEELFSISEFQLKIGNQTRKHSTKKIEKYETPSLFEGVSHENQ